MVFKSDSVRGIIFLRVSLTIFPVLCMKIYIFEHKRSKKTKQVFERKKTKDNIKVKVSIKVIQRIYDINPEIQEVIDAWMIEVCF